MTLILASWYLLATILIARRYVDETGSPFTRRELIELVIILGWPAYLVAGVVVWVTKQ